MKTENLQPTFPDGIAIPDALARLCAWDEANGGPISGGFELYADTHNSIELWFGTPAVIDRFGVFGCGPDGSLYAIWLQDDDRQTIVHMGSEGQNNFVLARDFVEFLRLLAVGYDEIGFDDLSQPPTEEPNLAFQRWVAQIFAVSIPAIGTEIVEKATNAPHEFEAWIETKVR